MTLFGAPIEVDELWNREPGDVCFVNAEGVDERTSGKKEMLKAKVAHRRTHTPSSHAKS